MGAVAAQARTGVAAYGAVAQQRQRSQRWCIFGTGWERTDVCEQGGSHITCATARNSIDCVSLTQL